MKCIIIIKFLEVRALTNASLYCEKKKEKKGKKKKRKKKRGVGGWILINISSHLFTTGSILWICHHSGPILMRHVTTYWHSIGLIYWKQNSTSRTQRYWDSAVPTAHKKTKRKNEGRFPFSRRFPEITGEDNLTVFSYSGRVKSPEWRWQRRRADLRHFEIFRHGPIIIYTSLPAGGTYYPICTFPASSECLIGISDAFSAFCLRVSIILPTCSLYPQQKRAYSALHPQAWPI